ncbi:HNH endonuclease, partial [Dietzia sp. B44]|nr:HNH endonuclease [Dietzia sp. B44]
MEQGVWDAPEQGSETAPLSDVLAFLEASVESLCQVDWSDHDADVLVDAVGRAEIVARRLEAAGARATAELAGLHRQKGRSAGGVAAMLAEKLGLARGVVHGRIEAGGRQATPAGRAA